MGNPGLSYYCHEVLTWLIWQRRISCGNQIINSSANKENEKTMNLKTKMNALRSIGMCLILLGSTTGCSAFRAHNQTLNITCNPEDAILTVNGQRYSSPVQVRVKRNRDVSVQCYKKGYVPYQRTIGHHFNATGALDAVGALLFLVPVVGLFMPGAWSLDETDLLINLYQK